MAPQFLRPRSHTGRTGLFAALVLLGLLTAELVLRAWVVSPSAFRPDARFGNALRPHTRVLQSDEGYGDYRTDSVGRLDRPWTRPRRARVLLLGDSYSAAQQVEYGERFSEIVEARLEGVEIVNSGRGGWYPPYYLAAARLERASLYDAIIVQLNDGDLLELGRPDRIGFVRDEDGHLTLRERPFPTDAHGVVRLTRVITRHSALATAVIRRTKLLVAEEKKRLGARFTPPPASAGDLGEADACDRIEAVLAGVKEMGTPLAVLYIPQVDYARAGVPAQWPEHGELYREACARAGVTYLDATRLLQEAFEREGQPLHGFHNSTMGGGHLNERGHRVVGSALADTVEGLLR